MYKYPCSDYGYGGNYDAGYGGSRQGGPRGGGKGTTASLLLSFYHIL